MKKNILLIILLILISSCSFTKNCRVTKNGSHSIIHSTGEKEELFYRNGKLEGKVLVFYKNGNIKQKLLYKNDKPEGKILIYHKNSKLSAKLFYKNGKLEGKVILWHENGIKRAKLFYSNGRKVSDLIVWSKYGEEINIINFKSFVSLLLGNSYKSEHEKAILKI